MRSVFLLGCRGAGTSMLPRMLVAAGYRAEDPSTTPSVELPLGRFEVAEFRSINDALLRPCVPPTASSRARGVPHFEQVTSSPRPSTLPAHLDRRARALLAAGPFALRDERLPFTLEAWRPLLGSAQIVCVFRDPPRVARALARELGISIQSALDEWTATYREILERNAATGEEILFLHADQLFDPRVRTRLSTLLEAPLAESALDTVLRAEAWSEEHRETEVSEEALRIFDQLCRRAACEPVSTQPSDAEPAHIAVLIPVLEEDHDSPTGTNLADRLQSIRSDLARSRGVRVRPVWIDASLSGSLRVPPARRPRASGDPLLPEILLRATSPTRAGAYEAAMAVVEEAFVAIAPLGTRTLPTRLAHAVHALLQGADCVTSDAFLTDVRGCFVDRTSPGAMGSAPGPLFEGGLVLRRDAFARMDGTDFHPVELDLWRRCQNTGSATHLTRPGFSQDASLFRDGFEESRADAACVTSCFKECAPEPLVTVILEASPRDPERPVHTDLLRTLRVLGRQSARPGCFEVLVLDAHGGAHTLTRKLEPCYSLRTLDRSSAGNRSRGACANAALGLARGSLLLFLDDRCDLAPDFVETHLLAHGTGSKGTAPRIGKTTGPHSSAALLEAWLVEHEAALDRDVARPHAVRLANFSVGLATALECGAFDASLEDAAAGDLLLRLEERGLRAVALPGAVARRHRSLTLADLERTHRGRGEALAALQAKHGKRAILQAPLWVRDPIHELAERVSIEQPTLAEQARGLAELVRLELSGLDELGELYAELADSIRSEVARGIPHLVDGWERRGYVEASRTGVRIRRQTHSSHPRRMRRMGLTPYSRSTAPELTVLLPTHDRPEELVRLLAALGAQDLPCDRFEVIVVDDASRRPAREVVAKLTTPYALKVLHQRGGGPGPARNLGLQHARGDIVLFLNDDAVPGPGLLRGHLLRQGVSPEPTAILGTFELLPEHRRHSIGEYVEQTTCLFAQPAMKPGVSYHGMSFCTGNLSIPRSCLEHAGGFDPSLPYAGGEDSELGLRLERLLGVRVVFDPDLRCSHDHALDASSILRRKRILGWTLTRIQERHGDLGLLPLAPETPWPLPTDAVDQLEAQLRARAPEIETLTHEIEALCEREVATGSGPRNVAVLAAPFGEAQRLETLRGVVDACRGRLPVDSLSEPAAALPGQTSETSRSASTCPEEESRTVARARTASPPEFGRRTGNR